MRRVDYLPAYHDKPVWAAVYRARRKPRTIGEHWVFDGLKGSRYAVFYRATATHWLVRYYRSPGKPKAITRLARWRWTPRWKVTEIWYSDPAA